MNKNNKVFNLNEIVESWVKVANKILPKYAHEKFETQLKACNDYIENNEYLPMLSFYVKCADTGVIPLKVLEKIQEDLQTAFEKFKHEFMYICLENEMFKSWMNNAKITLALTHNKEKTLEVIKRLMIIPLDRLALEMYIVDEITEEQWEIQNEMIKKVYEKFIREFEKL